MQKYLYEFNANFYYRNLNGLVILDETGELFWQMMLKNEATVCFGEEPSKHSAVLWKCSSKEFRRLNVSQETIADLEIAFDLPEWEHNETLFGYNPISRFQYDYEECWNEDSRDNFKEIYYEKTTSDF